MMKYGEDPREHHFSLSFVEMEHRDPWVDLFLALHMEEKALPEDLQDPAVWVICNKDGVIVQIILQNEGCDSEYQFTYMEKEQIERFVQEHGLPLKA